MDNCQQFSTVYFWPFTLCKYSILADGLNYLRLFFFSRYLPPHLRKIHGRVPHKSGQTLPSGSQSPHNQSPSPHQQPSPVRNLPVSGGARQPQTSSQRVTGQTTPVQVSVTTPVLTGDDAENKSMLASGHIYTILYLTVFIIGYDCASLWIVCIELMHSLENNFFLSYYISSK